MLECSFTLKDQEATLRLAGSATIDASHELRDALVDATARCQTLIIDVALVEAIDVSGLQLLCAAHKSAMLHYKCLCLGKERSDAFNAAIRDAGYHCSLPGSCLTLEGQTCLWFQPEAAGNWEVL